MQAWREAEREREADKTLSKNLLEKNHLIQEREIIALRERNSSRVSWRVSEHDTYNWFERADVSSKRNSTMRKISPCVEQIHTITSLIHIERLDYTMRTFAMLRGRHWCYRGMRRAGCWLSSKGHPRIYNTAKNTTEKRQCMTINRWERAMFTRAVSFLNRGWWIIRHLFYDITSVSKMNSPDKWRAMAWLAGLLRVDKGKSYCLPRKTFSVRRRQSSTT